MAQMGNCFRVSDWNSRGRVPEAAVGSGSAAKPRGEGSGVVDQRQATGRIGRVAMRYEKAESELTTTDRSFVTSFPSVHLSVWPCGRDHPRLTRNMHGSRRLALELRGRFGGQVPVGGGLSVELQLTSQNLLQDPAAISSAHPTILGGGNVKPLIGRDRRDRWMRVHHPRLVKRRYLLLKSCSQILPTFQPTLSSSGIEQFSHTKHSGRVHASRENRREITRDRNCVRLIDDYVSLPRDFSREYRTGMYELQVKSLRVI
jgi:hypothetical protein